MVNRSGVVYHDLKVVSRTDEDVEDSSGMTVIGNNGLDADQRHVSTEGGESG